MLSQHDSPGTAALGLTLGLFLKLGCSSRPAPRIPLISPSPVSCLCLPNSPSIPRPASGLLASQLVPWGRADKQQPPLRRGKAQECPGGLRSGMGRGGAGRVSRVLTSAPCPAECLRAVPPGYDDPQ